MNTDFDSLAFHLTYGEGSGFDALFRQAEQQLRNEKPDGYQVQEIGRLAWSKLPIEEYGAALRSLFYSYWLVDRQEQQEDQLRAAAASGMAFEESALTKVSDALSEGDPDDEGCVPVDYVALREVADEVVVLRKRLALLRIALEGGTS